MIYLIILAIIVIVTLASRLLWAMAAVITVAAVLLALLLISHVFDPPTWVLAAAFAAFLIYCGIASDNDKNHKRK